MTENEHGISFCRDENIMKFVILVIVALPVDMPEPTELYALKGQIFMVCEVLKYLNKKEPTDLRVQPAKK